MQFLLPYCKLHWTYRFYRRTLLLKRDLWFHFLFLIIWNHSQWFQIQCNWKERANQQLQAHLHSFDNQLHFWIPCMEYPFLLLEYRMICVYLLLFLLRFCSLVLQTSQDHDQVERQLNLAHRGCILQHSKGLFLKHFLFRERNLLLCQFDLALSSCFILKDLMPQLYDLQ